MSRLCVLDRLRFSPFLAQLVVTRRCNLSCGYCNEYDQTSEPVPFDVLRDRIDRLEALGSFAVELTGGEPMLHPRIYDLVRHSRARAFRKVMMISNAFLMNEEKVRRLNDAGLQALQVSVDGVRPNDVTVKVLDPLRRKLETIARVAEFEVTLSGVVGSAAPEETLEVVRFAKAHGFKPRVLVLHDHDGQMSLDPARRAELDAVQRAIGSGFREAHDYRAALLSEGEAPFRCRAGSRYLYIDEFGYVRWCSQTRNHWGKPLLDYTLADLRAQFGTKKDCNAQCTVGCARTCSAPDAWRGQSTSMPSPVVVGPGHRPPIELHQVDDPYSSPA